MLARDARVARRVGLATCSIQWGGSASLVPFSASATAPSVQRGSPHRVITPHRPQSSLDLPRPGPTAMSSRRETCDAHACAKRR